MWISAAKLFKAFLCCLCDYHLSCIYLFQVLLTFATDIVERNISGEICKSHFLESRRTDFAAANWMKTSSRPLEPNSDDTYCKAEIKYRAKKGHTDDRQTKP